MYGTIARLKVRPDMLEQFVAYGKENNAPSAPGWVATYVYQLDADPSEFMLVAVFESREAYVANAASPEQDAMYRTLRAMLVADPEWNDGEVVSEAHNT